MLLTPPKSFTMMARAGGVAEQAGYTGSFMGLSAVVRNPEAWFLTTSLRPMKDLV
jgi:hypothetical protein